MRRTEIHVGDRLRVREWDDMAAEFGTTDNGFRIHPDGCCDFPRGMKHLCGKDFTVSAIGDRALRSEEGIEEYLDDRTLRSRPWIVQAWMLEPGLPELSDRRRPNLTKVLFEQ